MRIALFSSKPYDRQAFTDANKPLRHDLHFFEERLNANTAPLAAGYEAICAFVNDDLGEPTLTTLANGGTKLVLLRSAGYNHVDLDAAGRLGLTVARVPAYSPHAVAEHTVALLLSLNRKTHRAYNRVREGNFALDGLLGFDLAGKTVGVIGTGKIGQVFARIMVGFGCRVLAFDVRPSPDLSGVAQYTDLPTLLRESEIVSLHCPLTPETRHLIDADRLTQMKQGVVLLNTSRGALVDTPAVIEGLKSGKVGALGLDVYEEEGPLFFEDRSDRVITDDVFTRLLTFPNVLVTGHQAFFTREALSNIAETTLGNATAFAGAAGTLHEVKPE